MRQLPLFWVACGVLTAMPAAPQPPATPHSFHIDVTVTAERAPQPVAETAASVSRLDRQQIETQPLATVAEALSPFPGVRVLAAQPSQGVPLVIARGFFGGGEAEYVQLRVDGVPHADAESGLAPWRGVALGTIQRVELLRGPGSSLYGDTAMGGVVQVFTDRTDFARAAASIGSFATIDALADGRTQRGPLQAGGTASLERSDGFRARGDLSRILLAARVSRSTATGSWNGSVSGERHNLEVPGPLTASAFATDPRSSHPLFQRDRDDLDRVRASLRAAWNKGAATFAGYVHAAHRTADRLRTILLVPGVADTAAQNLETGTATGGIEVTHSVDAFGRAFEWRAGVELERPSLDSAYAPVSPAGSVGAVQGSVWARRLAVASFASSGVHLTPRVRTYAGVRWDNLRDTSDRGRAEAAAWSPRAGIAVSLGSVTSAYVQVAGAFKAPTLDQRFDARRFPDFRGGTFTISNAALEPQRARHVEAGVRGQGRVRWSAVAYRMRVDDEIDFDVATFTYGNIGRSRHSGVELDAAWRADDRITVSGAYTWMAAVPLGLAIRPQLKNIPRHIWHMAIDAELPWALRAHARHQGAGRAFLDDDNDVPLRNGSTIDIRVTRQVGRVRTYVDLLNVADRRYAEYGFTLTDFRGVEHPYVYPAPGAAFRVGAGVRF